MRFKCYHLFALSALLLLSTLGVSAQKIHRKPFAKTTVTASAKAKVKTEATAPFEVVAEEHFSKFTAGTEADPDTTCLRVDKENYDFKPEYFEQPGWTGDRVWQAGGVAYLAYGVEYYYGNEYPYYGYLSTKEMALYGDVKISFRAKRAPGASTKTYLWVAVCDNDYGPVDDGDKDFYLTTEWQEFSMEVSTATFNDRNIVQFSAYEGELLIDDIVIERAKTRIPEPMVNYAINHSTTSFTASWSKVEEADDYLLHVYYMDMPEEIIPEATVVEGFDGINATDGIIDAANPNYPEGWIIDVSSQKATTGNRDVMTEDGYYFSGKQSIVMSEVDDSIVSPVFPAPLKKIAFWCRPSSMASEDYNLSMIGVDVLIDGEWVRMGNLPNFYLSDGGVWELEAPALSRDAMQLKISYIQQGAKKLKFYIDDVTCVYETQTVPYTLIEKTLTDTFYTVENYDNKFDHYYTVMARNSQATSDVTYPVWVDGLNGLKPTLLDATEVTTAGFTAHWVDLPAADIYKVNTHKAVTRTEASDEVVLIHETFDGIVEGTVNNPVTSYAQADFLAEKGYTETDWILQQPAYAKGMAGAYYANFYYGWAGLVVTPRLSLDNNGGAFDVYFKAYMTDPTDTLFVMILNEYTDVQATAAMKFGYPNKAAGLFEATAPFDKYGKEDVKIAFMSQNGMPFFIDEVKVTQRLQEGEVAYAPYKTVYVVDEASCRFDNIEAADNYTYRVQATATKDFMNYASLESDPMTVNTSASVSAVKGDEDITVYAAAGNIYVETTKPVEVMVYNYQGMLLQQTQVGAGVTALTGYRGMNLIVKAGDEVTKVVVR